MATLVPVDHDPFNPPTPSAAPTGAADNGAPRGAFPSLVPVDHDPFAAKATEAKPSFAGKLVNEINKGAQMAKEGIDEMAQPSSYLGGFKGLGKVALGGMQAAYSPVTAGAEKAGEFVTEKTGSKLAGKAVEIGLELAPPGKAIGAGERLFRTAKGVATSPETVGKVTSRLFDASQSTVDAIKNGAVVFDQAVGREVSAGLDSAINALSGSGRVNASGLVKRVEKYKETIDAGETTLHNFFDIRRGLREAAVTPGAEGEAARAAIKKIDGVLDSALTKARVVGGDPENATLIKKFNKEWGAYKSHETVADILTGEGARGIRAKALKFIDSPDYRFLSTEERKMMHAISKGRSADNIMSAVSRGKALLGLGGAKFGLLPETAAAGAALAFGRPELAAGIAGVGALGKAADLSARGDVARILETIAKRGK